MDIKVISAVVHEMVKEKEQSIIANEQNKVDKLLDVDDQVVMLIQKIHGIYGTRENVCEYGVFLSNDRQGLFPDAFSTYVADDKQDFLALTHTFFDELLQAADRERLSTGGYIVCGDYTVNGTRFIAAAVNYPALKGGACENRLG